MIRLEKLKNIVTDLVDQEVVVITLTTSEKLGHLIASVVFNMHKVDIILSSKCKSIKKIIQAISHETAHVILGSSQHTKEFTDKWKELEEVIDKKYRN